MNGLLENLTNPALLFFVLGIVATQIKNDLAIPANSSKFISIYLLLSIGFKGGNELAHSAMDLTIFKSMVLGIVMASVVPIWSFFILKRKVGVTNAGAIAATYGSVSAVTFLTAISFLEFEGVRFDGYMIAIMALMEAPAIVVGILLMKLFRDNTAQKNPVQSSFLEVLTHSINNASVFLIIGSLIIGFLASEAQAEGIRPFTTDIFKGFLAIFLLDMGIQAGKQLKGIRKNGWYLLFFASFLPFINGSIALLLSILLNQSLGNALLFAILGAGASYIAVPAAMKNAVPDANPGLYLPMALGITFPINILIGIPFYFYVLQQMNYVIV